MGNRNVFSTTIDHILSDANPALQERVTGTREEFHTGGQNETTLETGIAYQIHY
ncbi:MAG TPA: hypothetical protein VFN66_10805 [Burkholderiales bacterium]|nr:hypothetical protein [Burkholderiales bacterium]